jgi:hypothetical protein
MRQPTDGTLLTNTLDKLDPIGFVDRTIWTNFNTRFRENQ